MGFFVRRVRASTVLCLHLQERTLKERNLEGWPYSRRAGNQHSGSAVRGRGGDGRSGRQWGFHKWGFHDGAGLGRAWEELRYALSARTPHAASSLAHADNAQLGLGDAPSAAVRVACGLGVAGVGLFLDARATLRAPKSRAHEWHPPAIAVAVLQAEEGDVGHICKAVKGCGEEGPPPPPPGPGQPSPHSSLLRAASWATRPPGPPAPPLATNGELGEGGWVGG